MKNFFRLTLVSVLSISLLTSCCKLGYKKSCSSECSHSKKEEVKAPEANNEAKTEVKKTKKSKKAKKAEVATPASTETKKD